MLDPRHILRTAIVATAALCGSQVLAHGVESTTVTLPVIGAGKSTEVVITCSGHHYALSGGFENNDQLTPTGPLVVTASYPKSTQSWAIEVTNRSGRPTAINEARATLYALCGYRH